jgi:hypothetical protein
MADARVTPAMAAGVSQTLWSMEEVVRIVDEYEAKTSARYDSIPAVA